MEGRSLVWGLTAALRHEACQGAVPRPSGGKTMLAMMAPAVSTQQGEDNVVITNLIVIEISAWRAGRQLDLRNFQTSL